jgi:hypothetical protein
MVVSVNDEKIRLKITNLTVEGLKESDLEDVSVSEIVLGESLLTPGLQTIVTLNSYVYNLPAKNLDNYKNKKISMKLERPILEDYKFNSKMEIEGVVYRLDNRKLIDHNVTNNEEFTIHACDQSLLNDAKSLVSKSWKCTRPSDIVEYVLKSCAGVKELDVEKADPARDYIAENIHPFQVVNQQSNVALANGNDPSFLHYMTYDKNTHHFRSLASLCKEKSMATFKYVETGIDGGYANPLGIIAFSFPCDFDYLSDLLNGVDDKGQNQNTLTTANPNAKSMSQLGNQTQGCGMGGYNQKEAMTNKGTAEKQNSCETSVEKYLLKRQARLGLIERDKIALRMVVPWNPDLHAGKIITLDWKNKEDGKTPVYGSGDYLIVSMMHTIKAGGFATTTLDCVSKTVGQGVV